jgi:hypothetical protein
MRRKHLTLGLIILPFIMVSCVKQVTVDTRNEESILVVEGSITTDSVPYTVKLSYTGPYKFALEIPDQYLETEAKVSITDELGRSTHLVNIGKGVYETNDTNYIGKTGSSYQVIVELKNGKKYISRPETIKPAVPISKVNVRFVQDNNLNYPASMHVSIDTKDPRNEENYYKWDFYSWVMRETHGVSCGFFCIEYKFCYQKVVDDQVRIFSDAYSNGNEIKDRFLGRSYIYTYWNAFIDLTQHSLTREAYQFWQGYDEQVTRSGTILDPLPASIKGNVYNASDSTDFALGYFFASAVTRKKAILVPFNITEYLLNITAVQFIPDGPKICFDYFPNTLRYARMPAPQYPPPAGWENAERIEVRW